MSTYTQILYQIVFGTKNKQPVLTKNNREELFKYIAGILNTKQCFLYRINGVEDHLHILTHIHPSIALSALVKDIKVASSLYIKEHNLFANFIGWQEGYGAFTYSIKEKDRLINYIKNQEQHHHVKTFKEEYAEILTDNGIKFDERYLL